jgi:hypothetical protein
MRTTGLGWLFEISGALLIWAAYFMLAYGFAALACAHGFAGVEIAGIAIVPLVAGAAALLALAGSAGMLLFSRRRAPAAPAPSETAQFLRSTALWAALLALIAIAWTALPLLFFPRCG